MPLIGSIAALGLTCAQVRYAVVFLPDAQPDGAPPAAQATMNQRRFIFEPQALAIRAGQAAGMPAR